MERMFPAPGPITLTVDPTPGLFFPVWHSQVRWWESGDWHLAAVCDKLRWQNTSKDP